MTLTPDVLTTLRGQIDQRLGAVYPQGPRLLTEPIHYVLAGGGKRLRPILTLLTAQTCGGGHEDALHAAVGVEALHNFTLVHDDVMDGDHTRHGQPTVHTKWDDGVAILTGDAIFVLALAEVRRSVVNVAALTAAFTRGALAVCEGQALDKEFEGRSRVSMEDYLRMIDLKTGYLLGLAAEMGALCVSAGEAQVKGVQRFGQLLGRAFQIQDDLLEIFSDTGTMGKSLGSDLLAEKKTYLMISALTRAPEKVDQAIALAKGDLQEGLAALREVLRETDVKDEAEEAVRRTVDQAIEELAPLGGDTALLADFARLVLNRRK
ncbi:MAG: polyprenyl synthetase family protein [Candidatus Marinimicrobia bacterium]|nr:polyprenyl synthetase family protein [Candidatus Neomarinimicrobiota bacterium]